MVEILHAWGLLDSNSQVGLVVLAIVVFWGLQGIVRAFVKGGTNETTKK